MKGIMGGKGMKVRIFFNKGFSFNISNKEIENVDYISFNSDYQNSLKIVIDNQTLIISDSDFEWFEVE